MSYEKKPDTGALFRNDKKEKETHPDYKGDALVGGKLYWVSSWINESKSGTKYMSMSFKLKEQMPAADSTPSPAAPVDDEFNDACPF